MNGVYNPNSSYGRALLDAVASAVPAFGDVYIVVSSSDTAHRNYQSLNEVFKPCDGIVRFCATLEAALALVQSSNNDVIVMDGATTHAVSGLVTMSQNRVHVIGFDGGRHLVQQGSKLELTGAVNAAAVLKVTGVRNSFENIKFIQSSTHANALNVVQFAGEGTVAKNCSFIFGVADNLGSTSAAEVLMGEDSGTFIECVFGTDVLLSTASTGRAVMKLDAITGGNADGAKSNRFIDCEFQIMSSSANAVMILLNDTAGAKFNNVWVNPRFVACVSSGGGGVAITNAIASAAGFVDGTLAFIRPTTINCTNGCTTADHVVICGAPVFSSNAWEGGTPA